MNVYYKTLVGYVLMSKVDWEACAPEGKRPELLNPNEPDDDFLAWLKSQPEFAGKKLINNSWIVDKTATEDIEKKLLAAAKSKALAAAVEYADNLQAAILGDASPAAQTRLVGKYTAAVAIKSGAASAGDHAVIDAEVNLRPKYTKAQLVDVIIAKGTMAKQAEGMINGMLLLAQDAIEAAASLPDLDTAVKAITAKADAFKAQLLAGLQDS